MTAATLRAEGVKHRVVITPSRSDLIDAAFVVVLMLFALSGFRTTYSGSTYLIAGLAGVLLGVLIGHFANALRQPMIAIAAATLVVFFLAGGAIALRSTAIAGIVPSGSTFHGLADESVHGWKDLLTTLPPVASNGSLIVLPYLLGILGGVGAFCLARRTAPSMSPVVAPLLVLVAVILLGTATPAARLTQGGAFAVVALGWAALRAQRRRPAHRSGSAALVRISTAVALLAVAGIVGSIVGPHLPGLDSDSRTVLRSYVNPPTNIDRYPSPLAAFRKYKQVAAQNSVLFRVSGLPAGQPIRIATLDQYNGSVWSASNTPDTPDDGTADAFLRVGSPIPAAEPGPSVSYTVTVPANGYTDVWLPSAGEMTGIKFNGDDASADASSLRYNLATDTGVVLDGLRAGDSYTVKANLPSATLTKSATPPGGNETLEQDAAFLADKADKLGGSASSSLARLAKIEQTLRNGYYSDGIKPGQLQYLPGHYQTQLLRFLTNSELVGDDEQYASALALMADSSSIGIPARVVLGAVAVAGVVRGKDVRAWVQIQLSDGTWHDILPNVFTPDPSRTPHQKPQQTQPKSVGQKVPPPVATHPKSDQLDASAVDSSSSRDHKRTTKKSGGFTLPGWVITIGRYVGLPVLVLLLIALVIVGVKAQRRRRRRTQGTPALRLARGWSEIVDHARDLGVALPGGRTRREQAVLLSSPDVDHLAAFADARVFGAEEPADHDASEFWTRVSDVRKSMSRAVSRRRRIWAAVSLASLRGKRTATDGSA